MYYNVLSRINIQRANFDVMRNYFQTEELTTLLHHHLHTKKETIINKNPYKERYKNNNDLFLHIRLTDVKNTTLG